MVFLRFLNTRPHSAWAVAAAPTWQDAATYRLRWDAPQRDAGDPAAVLAPGAIDFAGLTRLRDGNADGVSRVDIGAVEYQPTPPVIDSVTPAGPATARDESTQTPRVPRGRRSAW